MPCTMRLSRRSRWNREFIYGKRDVTPAGLRKTFSPAQIAKGNLAGGNITIPYKVEAVKFMAELSYEARQIGAINTFAVKGDKLKGYNTDAAGCLLALAECGVQVRGRTAVVLGAGGAARAVAFALASAGADEIIAANRDRGKAEALAKEIANKMRANARAISISEAGREIPYGGLLINCTPLGSAGKLENKTPVGKEALRPCIDVMDLVYKPKKTRLLAEAERAGCRIVTGDRMLLYQGAEAFKIWTGRTAPIDVMRAALKEALR